MPPTAGSYKVAIEGEYKVSVSFEFGLYPNLWGADLQAEEALMKAVAAAAHCVDARRRPMMIRLFALSLGMTASPALAKKVAFELGDLVNGQALIKAHCGGCDRATLHDPMALAQVGEDKIRAALVRGQGIGPLKGWSGKRLHELEAWDVVRYLRSYSISLADLVPEATHYAIEDVVPNEYGRERLWREAKVFKKEPAEDAVRGQVIVVWSVPGSKGLVNVSGDTSVIGGFERDQKKAYVLFGRSLPPRRRCTWA